jgi:hypothetical protein
MIGFQGSSHVNNLKDELQDLLPKLLEYEISFCESFIIY